MGYNGKPPVTEPAPDVTSDQVAAMTLDQFKDWVMGRRWDGYYDPDFGHFCKYGPGEAKERYDRKNKRLLAAVARHPLTGRIK